MSATPSIDLFCRIVDNFGDIGVCWRLAKCLQRDQGCNVRLFVDDFAVFHRIEPDIDTACDLQVLQDITVILWDDAIIAEHYGSPADSVIEAFACTLPDTVLQTIRNATAKPVWIDLEYLSAESWVETHHGIPSPHPSMNIEKTLFFPGLTPRTGGLIREENLIADRNKFLIAQDDWRAFHGLPPHSPDHLDVSLFCYNDAPIPELITLLESGSRIPRLFVPAGVGLPAMWESLKPSRCEIYHLPFLTSADYDRLLWTSGLNFVRGEDSFVRAQWAGKPMVWHIYPQAEDHHFVKLRAFLTLYSLNLDHKCTDLLENFMILWNERGRNITGPLERIGPGWLESLPRLAEHAEQWAEQQAKQDDLATQLVRFIRQQKTKKDD